MGCQPSQCSCLILRDPTRPPVPLFFPNVLGSTSYDDRLAHKDLWLECQALVFLDFIGWAESFALLVVVGRCWSLLVVVGRCVLPDPSTRDGAYLLVMPPRLLLDRQIFGAKLASVRRTGLMSSGL